MLTITSHNQELIIIRDIMHSDVWERGDDLLLGGEFCALLKFEITNSSRERKVSIDASEVNKAASRSNSSLFAYISISIMSSNYFAHDLPSFCGLWSNERGLARPFTPRTLRESPALPYICQRESWCAACATYNIYFVC